MVYVKKWSILNSVKVINYQLMEFVRRLVQSVLLDAVNALKMSALGVFNFFI